MESVWRYRRMSVAIVAVGLVSAFAVSQLLRRTTPPRYTATARVALTDPRGNNVFRPGSSAGADLVRYIGERAAFAKSDRVLERAAQSLDRGLTAESLRTQVTTSGVQQENLITISATARDPSLAISITNAVVDSYRDISQADTVAAADEGLKGIAQAKERLLATLRTTDPAGGPARAAANQALVQLEQRASDIVINATLFGAGVNFTDPATGARPVQGTSIPRNVAAGGLIAFLIAVVVSWVRADRFQTADESEVPAAVFSVPLLGEIAEISEPSDLREITDPSSMPSDAYQFVTASLRSAMNSGVLVVTSSTRGEGKTVTAASIAVTAAHDGRRVVLIDADTRARGLTGMMPVFSESEGLTDLTLGKLDLASGVATVSLRDSVELSFISAGSSNPEVASLYRTEAMLKLIGRLENEYELVIFDCPPLLDVPDAASLIPRADGVLFVVQRGTPIRRLRTARQRLDLFPTELLGYVFTFSRRPVADGSYGPAPKT
ncbi:MAG: AAA family ATPase [Actinomycetota bacterium]|nr:AAA family ATPase [Actinomycetota bacterium]